MNTAKWYETTIKATGERVHFGMKLCWGKTYYSFNLGDTWHKSKSLAYGKAKQDGTLRPVKVQTTN